LPFNLPAVERAGFEVEVERFAVGADGDDAGIAEGFVEGVARWPLLAGGGGDEQKEAKGAKRCGEEGAVHK
jgi:hypothetical protein